MTLTNDTVFRGYLAHLQALARQRASLRAALMDAPGAELIERIRCHAPDLLREAWDKLRRDVAKVLGVGLRPFNELALPGDFVATSPSERDELRVTMGVLKKRCDKARRKDPTITLLKSWDLDSADHNPNREEYDERGFLKP